MRTPVYGIIAIVVALAGATLLATTSVTVAEGDTLTAIAARHGVTTAELAAWNEIDDPDRIFVGDVIVVVDPDGEPVRHVVSAGDTLSLIAGRYGASVADIAAANGLADVDLIRIGQQLTIGGPPNGSAATATTTTTTAASLAPVEHTVAVGETLFSIARRYERTVDEVASFNNIANPDRLRAGDVVQIPPADAPQAAPTTTTTPPTTTVPSTTSTPPTTTVPSTTTAPPPTTTVPSTATAPPTTTVPTTTVPTTTVPPAAAVPDTTTAAELDEAFDTWSLSYGVDQHLLEAIAWYATSWQPTASGLDGRIGIAQLTGEQVTFIETRLLGRDLDPFNGSDGIRLAARYLRYVQDRTDTETEALIAFRQGLSSAENDGPTADAEAFALGVLNIRDQRA